MKFQYKVAWRESIPALEWIKKIHASLYTSVVPRPQWLQTLGLCGTSAHLRGEPSTSGSSFSWNGRKKKLQSLPRNKATKSFRWGRDTRLQTWKVRSSYLWIKNLEVTFQLTSLSCRSLTLSFCWGFRLSLSSAPENVKDGDVLDESGNQVVGLCDDMRDTHNSGASVEHKLHQQKPCMWMLFNIILRLKKSRI